MKYLRFADLKARGIVNNRANLGNWIKNYAFPSGQMIGPNTRAWTEAEVETWLAARPTAKKAWTPKRPPRKADRAGVAA